MAVTSEVRICVFFIFPKMLNKFMYVVYLDSSEHVILGYPFIWVYYLYTYV